MLEIRASKRFSMVALLLLLGCVCTSTSVSFVVFQSPEFINASVGDSIELKCTRDLPIDYCYNSIFWYKVNPRSGILTPINTPNDELNQEKKTCTKTISPAGVQDSGLYYCLAQHDKMFFMGKGSRVVVTDPGPVKLSVVLYTPVEVEEGVDAPSVLLQCVVMDVVPSQIRVWWLVDENKRAGWTESGWTGHDDSASEYTRAQIRIPADEWRDAAHIQCVVTNGNETMSRTLQRETHSDSCTWLLYGGCSVAIFTIAVAITVTLCLRKEKRAVPVERRGVGVDVQRTHQGKQYTLRKPATEMEVEYSCLKPEIFTRQPVPHPGLERR